MGSVDPPFNALSVAIGAEAGFVARTHDLDRKHMMETFRAAHGYQGAAFVEIYQNCNVFNDGAFSDVIGRERREHMLINLVDGEPIRFGPEGRRGVVAGSDGALRIVDVEDVGVDALVVHDAERTDPSLAFALARGGIHDQVCAAQERHQDQQVGQDRRQHEAALGVLRRQVAAAHVEGARHRRVDAAREQAQRGHLVAVGGQRSAQPRRRNLAVAARAVADDLHQRRLAGTPVLA